MNKVLVIDDDEIAREMLCEVLRSEYQVFDLPSPIGAIRTIVDERIDAVVIDVMMPSIQGDKLARLLRDNPRGDRLAIILVSSRSEDELRAVRVSARADSFLTKRDVRSRLKAVVRGALEMRSQAG